MCMVNSRALNNKEGYLGHSIVIIGYTNQEFVLHDPGLPPLENRRVAYELFEKAWAYPDEKAKKNHHVKHFLKLNPNFYKGEELACMAEIRFSDFAKHISKYFLPKF